MSKRGYAEGDWFLIPVAPEMLREWGASDLRTRWGAGLVARGKRGSMPFVYVFGPFFTEPSVEQLQSLRPGGELTIKLIFDASLRDGTYQILWRDPGFRREEWPMPEFGMWMGGVMPAVAVKRDEDNPGKTESSRRVAPEVALSLPQFAFGQGDLYRRLIFPEEAEQRISNLWPSGSARSGASASWPVLNVDFVVPLNRASSVVEELEQRLSGGGWSVTIGEPTGASVWVSATRTRHGSETPTGGEIEQLDREMERIAAQLAIEYDGHGFSREPGSAG